VLVDSCIVVHTPSDSVRIPSAVDVHIASAAGCIACAGLFFVDEYGVTALVADKITVDAAAVVVVVVQLVDFAGFAEIIADVGIGPDLAPLLLLLEM
jgi:hypothetical protein